MCLKKEVYCHLRFPFIVKRIAFAPARKAYWTHGGLRFTHNRGVSSCSVSLLKFHIQFSFYTQQCSVPLNQIPLTSAYGSLPPPAVIGPYTCKEKIHPVVSSPLNRVKRKSMRNALVLGPSRGNFPREVLIETIAETGVRQNVVERSSEIR